MINNTPQNQITLDFGLLTTLLQYLIGAIGLKTILQGIWVRLNNPLIEITDIKISRYPYQEFVAEYDDYGQIIGAHEELPSTEVSWRVNNNIRFFIFSNDVHDIYAKYNFERLDSEGPRARRKRVTTNHIQNYTHR